MALPLTRNTTYSPDSVVRSADLNDIQDNIVNLQLGEFVTARVLHLPAAAAMQYQSDWTAYDDSVDSNMLLSIATGDVLRLPIPLVVGDRIRSLTAFVRSTTGTGPNVKLFKQLMFAAGTGTAATGTVTQVGSTATATAAATHQDLTISGLTETITARYQYFLKVTAGAGAQLFFGAEITYDHP